MKGDRRFASKKVCRHAGILEDGHCLSVVRVSLGSSGGAEGNEIFKMSVEARHRASNPAFLTTKREVHTVGLLRFEIGIAHFKSARGEVRPVGEKLLVNRSPLSIGSIQRSRVFISETIDRAGRTTPSIEFSGGRGMCHSRPLCRECVSVHAAMIEATAELQANFVPLHLLENEKRVHE